ncbi:MAG: preprotein translocase subunit SecG [Verrucomicrobia bacterium]|nr:preprotein translocase subunit SecG [Verrucomicrobiota bacterium]NBU09956.1 preprotein translocase subunit SecG [Pseudomonadota bacterium]NDA67068.1 preprotein translocase subunit SecG [Verrucomicrobiota bacterium]NDB76571.1 preprotein translocase subunit SecG [Verrucomicrobiota bacterium]NDD39625.1 preprotein translocase subunit SecG [Verrucomicrobiota bacterium]
MSFLVGLLTAVLVLDSLFLILLILVQLPKKEAGVGQAFGGGATDALFGAGTGNALTQMTKYAAGIFLSLCLVLYVMGGAARKGTSSVREELKKGGTGSVLPPKPSAPPAMSAPPVAIPPPASILSNAPAATNPPAAKAVSTTATQLLPASNAVAPKAVAPATTPPSTTPPAKK